MGEDARRAGLLVLGIIGFFAPPFFFSAGTMRSLLLAAALLLGASALAATDGGHQEGRAAASSTAPLKCVHGVYVGELCTCEAGYYGRLCDLTTSSSLPPSFPIVANTAGSKTVPRLDVDHGAPEGFPTMDYDASPEDVSYCPNACSGRGDCNVKTRVCTCHVSRPLFGGVEGGGWGGGYCGRRARVEGHARVVI